MKKEKQLYDPLSRCQERRALLLVKEILEIWQQKLSS